MVGTGVAGFLWAGGLQLEPWHVAEWPLILGHGRGAVGFTPLISIRWDGWAAVRTEAPFRSQGQVSMAGGVGLLPAANETFPQLLPFASRRVPATRGLAARLSWALARLCLLGTWECMPVGPCVQQRAGLHVTVCDLGMLAYVFRCCVTNCLCVAVCDHE